MDSIYYIISPARNEEKFIESTIQSVINQTILPKEWIVVNDGSKDRTEEIVKQYCSQYNWIKLINLPDRGYSKYGSGVVEAFYKAFDLIKDENFDFVVKLDCDLSFDKDYFRQIFIRFELNAKLGIASGHTYIQKNGKLIWEDAPLDHTRGPSKVYKKECFEDIGGLKITLGWDNIDEVTARMNGWETRSYTELKLTHLRQLGSTIGILAGNRRHGYTDYITGYHPLYFLIKTIYRLFSKPIIIGSLSSFWGYFSACVRRVPKPIDKEFIKYIRKEQKKKLLSNSFWKIYFNKYSISWWIGTIISTLIYFSGIHALYLFLNNILFKNKRGFILTYHHISDIDDRSISVTKKSFRRQIDFLYRKFIISSLDDILDNRNEGKKSRVAITFDDGYADFVSNAFDILNERNATACVFLIYNRINSGDKYLSSNQIIDLIKSGISFGSHTLNHPVLSTISIDHAKKEIANSKILIEEITGNAVKYFAYPKGKRKDFTRENQQIVKETGYSAAFTTINGNVRKGNMMRINRIGIRECPFFVFKVRVSGIYESELIMAIRKVFNLV
ncbi:MAG: polysaccharide deacetylase family protein [Bacteroidales bacterium]|nr:polysaccharide deacetylase family protein [Bacteroidales bacterium]